MSLFGKVETPRAERSGPAVKPLTELSLRVSGARLEPEQNVVRLHAENMLGGNIFFKHRPASIRRDRAEYPIARGRSPTDVTQVVQRQLGKWFSQR